MASLSVLRNFLTVVELGEIRAAADRLGRTPSAVSMALKQFEEEIGARLFEGDRKNKLTPTGSFVALHAGEVLRHYERVEASIRDFVHNASGRVDLACVPSVASILLPKVILKFRALAPRVSISLRDMDSKSVIHSVEKGEVGIGVASSDFPHGSLAFAPLFSEPLGIVCRSDHPLAKMKPPVPMAELRKHSLLINNFTKLLKGAEGRDGTGAQLEASTVTSALGLVRAGLGITILSRLTVPHWDSELVFLPLREDSLVRRVGVLTRSEESVSPAESLLIEVLRETVDQDRRELNFL